MAELEAKPLGSGFPGSYLLYFSVFHQFIHFLCWKFLTPARARLGQEECALDTSSRIDRASFVNQAFQDQWHSVTRHAIPLTRLSLFSLSVELLLSPFASLKFIVVHGCEVDYFLAPLRSFLDRKVESSPSPL